MKSKLLFIMMSFVILLTGCATNLADNPEDALKKMKFEKNEIDSEQKEIKVYGTHQVNDSLVLIVCRGVMNDKDIWIADVHKKGEKWEAEEISQMNGPLEWLEWDGDIQSITKNDEFGYEFGYIKSGASPTEDLNVIEVEGISDWKIWIK